jgi:hypothetical protein
MLAMLSCVFCEPAAREGVSNASMGLKHEVGVPFTNMFQSQVLLYGRLDARWPRL